MTYGQVKKDFMLFAVFVPVIISRWGRTKLKRIDLNEEDIPDDTEGRVGAFDLDQDYPTTVTPRLCFIANDVIDIKMNEGKD